MNTSLSFFSLLAVSLGMIFVMPQSPLSIINQSLEVQVPELLVATSHFIGGGMQGLPDDGGAVSNPFQSGPITDPIEYSPNSSYDVDTSASGFMNSVNTSDNSSSGIFGGSGGTSNSSGGSSNTSDISGGSTGSSQSGGGSGGRALEPVLKDPTIKGFLTTLLGELVKIGYVIGVIYIVYAGFLFVTGGESDAKRQKAKDTLLWTVIGIGILLGAQAIAYIVSSTIEAIAKSAA